MFYHEKSLRPTSELCVRCGLCCVVLKAQCTPEEAKLACPEHPERFAEPDEYAAEGKLLMKFPCMYLRGRVLGGTFCSIYGQDRPKVCSSYLCRIAMLFSQNEVNLERALQQLKIAFWSGDVSVFNWAGLDGEQVIMQRQAVWQLADTLKAQGNSSAEVDLWVANQCTPSYWPKTPLEHSLFSMHFMAFDWREGLRGEEREKAEQESLKLYYETEEVEQMSKRDQAVARTTVRQVLSQLRMYVANLNAEEMDGGTDSLEADRPAEAGEEEGGAGVPPRDVEDRRPGGEGTKAGLRVLRGGEACDDDARRGRADDSPA